MLSRLSLLILASAIYWRLWFRDWVKPEAWLTGDQIVEQSIATVLTLAAGGVTSWVLFKLKNALFDRKTGGINPTAFGGIGVAGAVLWFGVLAHAPNPTLFLDPHALILVLGGTLAAMMIGFPASRVVGLLKLLVFGVLFKSGDRRVRLAREITEAARHGAQNPLSLQQIQTDHPFLDEGLRLIAEGILSAEEMEEVLKLRSAYFKRSYGADGKMLTALSKFPPAFGLLGASTGMITMMTNLGTGGKETIGASMAVALVATFWGIAVANLILLPLADYASRAAEEDAATRQMIVVGLMMIMRKTPPHVITEKLNSFLPVTQRRAAGAVSRLPGSEDQTQRIA